ncbi:hypothetical protein [Mesobacterium pallidum]|nr:hypothetical protein [Mesobacterium pallidum]
MSETTNEYSPEVPERAVLMVLDNRASTDLTDRRSRRAHPESDARRTRW